MKFRDGQVDGRRKKHIGNLLETARKIRGLTADEVGKRCNLARSRVYQLEKAKYVLPKNLSALAAALKVPLPMLIAENGNRPPRRRRLSAKQ